MVRQARPAQSVELTGTRAYPLVGGAGAGVRAQGLALRVGADEPAPVPLPGGITDTFNRANQAGLGIASSGLAWIDHGISAGAAASIQSGRGVLEMSNPGSGSTSIGQQLVFAPPTDDYDFTITASLVRVSGTSAMRFLLYGRRPDNLLTEFWLHSNNDTAPNGGMIRLTANELGTGQIVVTTTNPLEGWDDTVARDFKVRLQRTNLPTLYADHRAKVWWADEPEPDVWYLQLLGAQPFPEDDVGVSVFEVFASARASSGVVRATLEDLDIEGVP